MTESNVTQLSEAAAEWLLSALGNGRLYAAVMAVPTLQDSVFRGGFQMAPATLAKPTIRRRLRLTLLGRADRVESLLRESTEAPWTEARRVLQALDGEWLRRNWRGLLRASGHPALAAAMAADERDAIRRRGLRLLRRTAPWLPTWTAQPQALPAELKYVMPPPSAATCPEAGPRPAPVADAGLQHEAGALRDALSRQRDKVRHGEQELRQARLEWEQREKDLRREVREARAEAELAAAEVERRLAEAIGAFRREALGVTDAVEHLAEAAADTAADALIERAERVLEAQRQQNDAYGSYEAIRGRIRALGAVLQRLGVCMDESVKVLPDVPRLHVAVCRELDRLQALLPEETAPASELSVQLLARIKAPAPAAAALAKLERTEELLRLDVVAELLGEEGVRHLSAAIAQRRRLVVEALHGTPTPSAPTLRQPREIWDVRAEVSSGAAAAARIFVDGYNGIRRVPDLAALEANEGLARSREVFCGLCRNRARAFAHLEVVFDGQGALSAREESDGLTVVFSNGLRESQNADEYLLARVTKARAEGTPVWLVTDDRGLRARSELYCDAVVGCEDWYRFLR